MTSVAHLCFLASSAKDQMIKRITMPDYSRGLEGKAELLKDNLGKTFARLMQASVSFWYCLRGIHDNPLFSD